MTGVRERRRPAGSSPIALAPKIEPIRTPPPTSAAVEPRNLQAAAMAAEPRLPQGGDQDGKIARTFQLPRSLLREAQTAVLMTAPYPRGYASLNALVTGAIERELVRLSEEFNAGAPFPPHEGAFRRGRPIGS